MNDIVNNKKGHNTGTENRFVYKPDSLLVANAFAFGGESKIIFNFRKIYKVLNRPFGFHSYHHIQSW